MVDLSLEAIANAYPDYAEEKDLSLESIMTRNGALDVISPYRPTQQPPPAPARKSPPPQAKSSSNNVASVNHPALPPKPSKQKLELLLKVRYFSEQLGHISHSIKPSKERAVTGVNKVKDMVHSIEQISRTDNFRAITTSSSSSNNNNSREVAAARLESTLNVTSVEVEWEKTECAETSSVLPEDDVESSVSAATTASREAGKSIELNFNLMQ